MGGWWVKSSGRVGKLADARARKPQALHFDTAVRPRPASLALAHTSLDRRSRSGARRPLAARARAPVAWPHRTRSPAAPAMEPGGPQASLRQASEAAPRNLDIASLDHVCSFVESLSTLASLQATCRTLAPLAKAAAARLDARWQDFLRTAPRPEVHGLSRRARRRAAELDERFKLFVLSERAEAAFEGLSNVQRKHLHFRAGQLGIASASSDEEGVGRVLCLTKPPGWVLEWRAREPPPPPYYPRPSDSCHECGTGLSSRERRNNRNWWRIERGLDADWAFCNSCLYHESEDEDEDEDRWR